MRSLKTLLAALVLLAILAPTSLAAGGNAKSARLDPTFGKDGKAVVRSSRVEQERFPTDRIAAGAAGAAGKSYVLRQNGFMLFAFGANGKADPTFGKHGRVRLPIDGSSLAVDSRGRVLVVGSTSTGTDAPAPPTNLMSVEGSEARVLRYLPNGSPDPSFGAGGDVATDFGLPAPVGINDQRLAPPGTFLPSSTAYERPVVFASSITVDSQDRPVVAGSFRERIGFDCEEHSAAFVARLGADGAPDPSFGSTGHTVVQNAYTRVQVAFVPTPEPGFAVLQKDQRECGPAPVTNFPTSVTTLNEAGAPSPGFTPRELELETPLAVDSKGRILVVPHSQEGPATVLRLLPNGATDPGFGAAGVASLRGLGFETIAGLATDKRGRVLVGGRSVDSRKFQLARLSADGHLEHGFGKSGDLTVGFGRGTQAELGGLTIDARGRILEAGLVRGKSLKGGGGLGLARLLSGS